MMEYPQKQLNAMLKVLDRFEKGVTSVLAVLMALVILLAVLELAWLLAIDIVRPPVMILEVDELLEIFGTFLMVLIGIELLETIKAYMRERVVHVEVVLSVALIAISRKVIVLEYEKISGWGMVGIAAIVAALAGAYYVLRRLREPATTPPG